MLTCHPDDLVPNPSSKTPNDPLPPYMRPFALTRSLAYHYWIDASLANESAAKTKRPEDEKSKEIKRVDGLDRSQMDRCATDRKHEPVLALRPLVEHAPGLGNGDGLRWGRQLEVRYR